MTLGETWDRLAEEWGVWAREPGHDSYWTFHGERFHSLVPPPDGLTLDLACGEGRVGRDLEAAGHRVVALDVSPAMCRLTRGHPHPLATVCASSTKLPFAGATFGTVVAFMAFHDMDDLDGALSESARVLRPGGTVVAAVIHPLNSAGHFRGDRDQRDAPFVLEAPYLEQRRYLDVAERDGFRMAFHGTHRPLEAYSRAVRAAGLVIAELREVTVPEPNHRWSRIPLFLHLVLRHDQRPSDL